MLRIACAVALVGCGWLALLTAFTFAGPQRTIAIIGPQAQAIAAVVTAGGLILVASDYVTIARSEEAGFVGRAFGWYEPGEGAGWIASVLGAILVLFIVQKLRANK